MNQPKHTKGPWQSGGCVVWQTDGDMICDLSTTRRLPDTIEANTERIVRCVNACEGINPDAIPDLLAACYAALASGPMLRGALDRTADENALHEFLWAAIRKATGEGE